METFSALLALCAGNSPITGEFPAQRPVTRSFDVFFDLRLNKRLSKQSWGWWFETLSRPLRRHRNAPVTTNLALWGLPVFSDYFKMNKSCIEFGNCQISIIICMKEYRVIYEGKTLNCWPLYHGWLIFYKLQKITDVDSRLLISRAQRYNRPISQIPKCTCSISYNAPFRSEIVTFLFWMEHCGIWDRCILGFVN